MLAILFFMCEIMVNSLLELDSVEAGKENAKV